MDKVNLPFDDSGRGLERSLVSFLEMLDRNRHLCLRADRINCPQFALQFAGIATSNIWPSILFGLRVPFDFLKNTFRITKDSVITRSIVNPHWQNLSGATRYRHRAPLEFKTSQQFDRLLGSDVDGQAKARILSLVVGPTLEISGFDRRH